MRYCENCGASLKETAKFCDQCGAPVKAGEEVKKYCKNCQAQLEQGALFCPECGYRAVEDPEPTPGPEPTPDPEPTPVPNPTPGPEPIPEPTPDPPNPQKNAPALISVGLHAFRTALIAVVMSFAGAIWMAEESSWMDFAEAFLLIGAIGMIAWLIAVFLFAITRNYQKAAQRERDPQRQRLLERQAGFLETFGYLLVFFAPLVQAFACLYL